MASKLRRRALHKDTSKNWHLKRDRRGLTWAQRKAKSKEHCASTNVR